MRNKIVSFHKTSPTYQQTNFKMFMREYPSVLFLFLCIFFFFTLPTFLLSGAGEIKSFPFFMKHLQDIRNTRKSPPRVNPILNVVIAPLRDAQLYQSQQLPNFTIKLINNTFLAKNCSKCTSLKRSVPDRTLD